MSLSFYCFVLKRVAVFLFAILFVGSSTKASVSLVSNLANSQSEENDFWQGRSLYQSFRTGSAAATIEGIKFSFGAVGTPSTVNVSVYSDFSGKPGTVLASFLSPASLAAGYGEYNFTGSLGVIANSNYWAVLSATGGMDADGNIPWSTHNYVAITYDLADVGMAGWSLADSHWNGDYLDTSLGGFGEYTHNPIKMQITGTSVPEPSAAFLLAIGLGSLALVRRKSRA